MTGVRRAAILSALLVVAVAVPVAAATAPANDAIQNATPVTSLPFDHTVDLAGATSSPGDLDCGDPGAGHTVWYRFTPATSGHYGAAGIAPDFSYANTDVTIARGPRSGPVAVACNGWQTDWTATAGTRYWIEVAQCCGGPGQPTLVHVERIHGFTVTIGLTSATVDHLGNLTLTGTLACNRDVVIFGREMIGEVSEKVGKYQAIGDIYTDNDTFACSTAPSTWTWAGSSYNGANFVVGTAAVSLGSDEGFCSYFNCGREVDLNAEIRVTRA